ncbi:MAG: GNAT family N-acetyltransferase [Acutalibacter sp.]
MEIRPMEWTDYQKVYALWLSCPGMGLNDLDDSLEGIGRFLQRNPETCFVAVEGESIAGCILAGTDGRRAYIYHTAVRPEFRRRGIGRQLVERLLAALQKIGIHKAALVAFSRNQPGNAFWEKMGFTVRTDLTYRNRALTELRRIDT